MTATFDVFVSHAAADRAWVHGYLLPALGLPPERVITPQEFQLGAGVVGEFERAVTSSRYTILILTPAYLGDEWASFGEQLSSFVGVADQAERLVPLVLQPTDLPLRIDFRVKLDCTDQSSWASETDRLRELLTQPVPAPTQLACPYPGMVPFRAEDTRFFYGREAEISQLQQLLRLQPLVFVIGPSGSGKSSLVFAGLLPRVSADPAWTIKHMRPGANPPQALRAVFDGVDPAQAATTWRSNHPAPARLLLVVDQFEEAFTQASDQAQNEFIGLLQAFRKQDGCALVITMRADFYPDLMTSHFWPLQTNERLEVAPLRGDALRAAITQPAEDVGVYVEPGLVERLLADADNEPGALPLVQETMVLLWSTMNHRLLTLHAYETLGRDGRNGLAVAMAAKADATLAQLNPKQQVLARRIFLRLVQFGEGRSDTRRQQPISELSSTGDDPAEFAEILEHLTANRLLTRSGDDAASGPVVDIAHEMLIVGWPMSQAWVQARREAEQARRRLEAKALEWIRLGSGTGGLLDVAELAEAERWLESSEAADLGYESALPTLIQASRAALDVAATHEREHRERELQQAQQLAARQTEIAEEQRRRAEDQARAARRLRLLTGLLAAIFLVAVGAAILATQQQRQAQAAKTQADQSAQLASTRAAEAIMARQTAEAEQQESQRLREIALIQGLSAQGIQQETTNQDERGALLVRQAAALSKQRAGASQDQVDDALRTVLERPFFSRVLPGHSDKVAAVTFSPDGQWLASGGYDKTIRVWNLSRPGTLPQVIRGLGTVYALAWSPDSQTLAASSSAENAEVSGVEETNISTIRLWQVTALSAEPQILRGHSSLIRALVFSPDGKTLASGSWDQTVRLWDLQALDRPPTVLTTAPGFVTSLAWHPKGDLLAAGISDFSSRVNSRVMIWSLLEDTEPVIELPHPAYVATIAWSVDGRFLASGTNSVGEDNLVRVWERAILLAPPLEFGQASTRIEALAWHPDGRLAVGSNDTQVRLWNLAKLDAPQHILQGHIGEVVGLAWSADGSQLASASTDTQVRVWLATPPATAPVRFEGHTSFVYGVDWHPTATLLASAGEDESVRVWNIDDQTAIEMPGRFSWVLAVAWSPDGKHLAAVDYSGRVRLWPVDAFLTAIEATLPNDVFALSLAWSQDSKQLAVGTTDGLIRIWPADDLASAPIELRGHQRNSNILALAFSPDNQTLASGSSDGTVRLWTWQQPSNKAIELGERDPTRSVYGVDWNQDGTTLVSGSEDGLIRLWQVSDPSKPPTIIRGHEARVYAVQFSPNDTILASGSGDGTLRLWNWRTPSTPPSILRSTDTWVYSLAWSPDGDQIASGGSDGVVRIWTTNITQLAAQVCTMVWRNLSLTEWQRFVGPDLPYQRTCANLPAGQDAPSDAPAVADQ